MGRVSFCINYPPGQKLVSINLEGHEFRTLYLVSFYWFRPPENPLRVYSPYSKTDIVISKRGIVIGKVEIMLPEEVIKQLPVALKKFFTENLISPPLRVHPA